MCNKISIFACNANRKLHVLYPKNFAGWGVRVRAFLTVLLFMKYI